MTSPRRTSGHPSGQFARSLGMLVIMRGRLVAAATEVDARGAMLDGASTWLAEAQRLCALADAIERAAVAQAFRGFSSERVSVEGEGGIRLPADADYLDMTAQRMERHTRIGLLLLPEHAEQRVGLTAV